MPSEQGRKTLHRRRKRGGSYAGELLTRRPPKNLHTGGRTNEKLKHALAALVVAVMERIGDQAEDIAEIITTLGGRTGAECADIRVMAEATIKMVTDSVDAYVRQDLPLAQAVEAYDDVVDDAFCRVKNTLIAMIAQNTAEGEYALDLLMIAKYFERIGDHAVNIAEWVEFSVTGEHKSGEILPQK